MLPVFIFIKPMQKAIIITLLLLTGVLGYVIFTQQKKLNEAAQVKTDTLQVPVEEKKGKGGKRKFVNLHIDSIAIHKAERILQIFSKQQLVKTYNVALGINPVGKKEIEGDYKTPEGWYYIDGKNPFSTYHKSLGVSYPNAEDKEHANALGQKPGGDIKIHGLMKNMNNTGKNHIKSNWTWGCVAVTNEEIDELYQQIKVRTPVYITP